MKYIFSIFCVLFGLTSSWAADVEFYYSGEPYIESFEGLCRSPGMMEGKYLSSKSMGYEGYKCQKAGDFVKVVVNKGIQRYTGGVVAKCKAGDSYYTFYDSDYFRSDSNGSDVGFFGCLYFERSGEYIWQGLKESLSKECCQDGDGKKCYKINIDGIKINIDGIGYEYFGSDGNLYKTKCLPKVQEEVVEIENDAEEEVRDREARATLARARATAKGANEIVGNVNATAKGTNETVDNANATAKGTNETVDNANATAKGTNETVDTEDVVVENGEASATEGASARVDTEDVAVENGEASATEGASAAASDANATVVATEEEEAAIDEGSDNVVVNASEIVEKLKPYNLLKRSAWVNKDGKFNTTRLLVDTGAGAVLGTVGGVIANKVIRKNQISSGMDGYQCVVNGQTVAEYGDDFVIDIYR